MSYTVFALKWRPRNFEEIIGQAPIVENLTSGLQKGRLANAYLFAGPRGVGKTSTARILAKALNCKEGPTANPCLKCPACLEISDGRSLDVIEIDGASNRGIDEIRVLRENVKFAPTAGKFKIYIIDEVHMLTTEAFNALLKTLEEPPEFVKFIFATTQPHKVIPTILSRCQRFDFRRVPALQIAGQLERIAKAENISVDKEVLFTIAKSSDGSLRDAESVLDQLFSLSKEKISLKDVVSVLGLVEQEALFSITDKIIQKDAKSALSLLNAVIDSGKDIGVFLTNLIEHFRNLMVAKVTKADEKIIDLPQEICQLLLRQSEGFTLEELSGAFNILANTQEMAKRLESLRIPLEINLVRLAHDKKAVNYAALAPAPAAKQPEPARPQAQNDSSAKEKPKDPEAKKEDPVRPHHPDPAPSVALEAVKDAWRNIIDNLGRSKMSLASYLNEGEPLQIKGDVLTVGFSKNLSLHKESLEERENKALIEKCILESLRAPLKVHFILTEETKKSNPSTDGHFIKSALDMFGGRVIQEE